MDLEGEVAEMRRNNGLLSDAMGLVTGSYATRGAEDDIDGPKGP